MVAAAAEVVVATAVLVCVSSHMIPLVGRGSGLSLSRHAGCLGNSDGVPDGVNSGLALLGLVQDVCWLRGTGEGSSCLGSGLGNSRKSRLGNEGLLRNDSWLVTNLLARGRVSGLCVAGGLSSCGLLRGGLRSGRLRSGRLGSRRLVTTGRGARGNLITVRETTERVVSGQLAQSTLNLLVDLRLDSAVTLVQTVGEARAVVHTGGTGVTCVDNVLKDVYVPAGHEVSVAAVTSDITVGEDKRLLALTLSPTASELVSAPVSLVEEVGNVNPALGAVQVTVVVLGVGHVVLEVGKASLGVVARGEVNISSERRVFAVTSSVRKADTLALVDRVADSSLGTIGSSVPRWECVVVVQAGASHSRGVDRTLGRVQVGLATSLGHGAGHGITSNNLKTNGERLDVVVCLLETGIVVSNMLGQWDVYESEGAAV